MKAILIDPFKRSLETITLKKGHDREALEELHALVGEDCLDWAHILPGEAIYLGDHSALQNPPLASYMIEDFPDRLYGRGVVIGHDGSGAERDTKLSVDDLWQIITWYET